jgi:hypothetical protein
MITSLHILSIFLNLSQFSAREHLIIKYFHTIILYKNFFINYRNISILNVYEKVL